MVRFSYPRVTRIPEEEPEEVRKSWKVTKFKIFQNQIKRKTKKVGRKRLMPAPQISLEAEKKAY